MNDSHSRKEKSWNQPQADPLVVGLILLLSAGLLEAQRHGRGSSRYDPTSVVTVTSTVEKVNEQISPVAGRYARDFEDGERSTGRAPETHVIHGRAKIED